ncbi:MAG: hypothetical protein IIC60_07555 [Proteobacteria bacterium]|nr:hypothetical protein [Pseudomonadota bacterium]
MNNFDGAVDFEAADLATDSITGIYDSAPAFEPARCQDEYPSFEFEAMTEVPHALSAFISHQHTFDL